MQRRTFFQRLATGLVGVGLAGGTELPLGDRPSVEQGKRRPFSSPEVSLKKGVKLHLLDEDLPLLEKFRVLKDLGFDGVDVRAPTDQRSREDLLRAQDQTGLSIHGVLNPGNWSQPLSSPDPKVREQGRKILRAALAEAAAFGASTVLLIPAVVSSEVSYDDAWNRSQREVQRVLPAAEEHDVTIAFENVWNHFLLSPLEFARYIDAFESDYVGAYLDIGNTLTYGWPEQWLRILGSRVVKLDVKDRSREQYDERGQAVRVKLGEGSCDWEAVQAALEDIGFQGWGTAEVPGGDRARLREISRRMSQVLPFA